ncbi:MAG: hypothetical protein ACRD8O_24295 [Bryobacteraceae bacterium]
MEDNKPNHEPAVGHEESDVSVGAITKFGIMLTLFVIVCLGLMWFLYDRLSARESARTERPTPLALSDPQKQPPEPRLQSSPVSDLQRFRADEDAILKSYGWVDSDKNIVRIPVERAKELVAREGLPSRRGAR